MKGKMFVYYDEEGDFLEIGMEKHGDGYFKDLEEDVSVRIDEKTGKVVGIAIMNFKKRTKELKDIEIKLPFKIEL
ncbi:DUF2283 domain-containing protein [Candidatus Woesearchaeota archaeon]|nr:DUF2283 domain-containing protein [Candidatus Woesearchaeota archaeon]